MTKCEHGYNEPDCWNCHPEILEEAHRVYDKNINKLREAAEKDPSLLELYQDVRCIGSVVIDWDIVFSIIREKS